MSRTSAAVIAGLGMTELGRVYGSSQRQLACQAVRAAAADAGLRLADLNGLLICPGITGGLDVGLAAALGLRDLSLLALVTSYGASACAAIQVASLAVGSGSATAIACVFADAPLREGAPTGSAFGGWADASRRPERHGLRGLLTGYGYTSVTAHYALAARRHMAAYGTTSEQLGAIAVAQRQWAAGNPLAQHRDPISIADHQRSRFVAEPLHLLDCSLVSNGAIAIIVTSAGRAADAPRPPVHIWGWGQGHPGHPMRRDSQFGLSTGAAQAGTAAMAMARIGPRDITMCQLYDCYTYTVLVTLEDYQLCNKGEGGAFAASGALAPGGSLPTNTGGGQLSGYYMWGFTPLSEAVIQARGDGGQRQEAATDVILVSGNGGILAHHGTLILSPHPAGPNAAAPRPGPPAAGPGPARETTTAATTQPATAGTGNPATAPAIPGPAAGGTAAAPATPGRAGGSTGSCGTAADASPGHLLPLAAQMGQIRADARSAEFFAAAAQDQLLARRCGRCGQWLDPTAGHCPGCGDRDRLAWSAVSGRGTLISWAVTRSRDGEPVAVPALVELAEGPWLHTGLQLGTAAELASLRAGQPVTATFVHPRQGESYPLFRPAG